MYLENGSYYLKPDGEVLDVGHGKHKEYAEAHLRRPLAPGQLSQDAFMEQTGYIALVVHMGHVGAEARTPPTPEQIAVMKDLESEHTGFMLSEYWGYTNSESEAQTPQTVNYEYDKYFHIGTFKGLPVEVRIKKGKREKTSSWAWRQVDEVWQRIIMWDPQSGGNYYKDFTLGQIIVTYTPGKPLGYETMYWDKEVGGDRERAPGLDFNFLVEKYSYHHQSHWSEYSLEEMRSMNYYEVLGVPIDSDPQDIRQAYRVAARKYHPDISKEPDAVEKMKIVNEAWEVLGNPESKADYDRRIPDAGGPPVKPRSRQYPPEDEPWKWAEMTKEDWEDFQRMVREDRRKYETTRTQMEFQRLWRSAGRERGPMFAMASDAEVWECMERIKKYGKCWAPAYLTHMSRGVYHHIYGAEPVKGYIYVDGVPSYTAVVADTTNEIPIDDLKLLPQPYSNAKVTTWHLVTEIKMLPITVVRKSGFGLGIPFVPFV